MGGPEVKVATVDVESGDNMATLPVSRAHTSSTDTAEKNNAANKEMELKNVMPKPLQRYSIRWMLSINTIESLNFTAANNFFLLVFNCSLLVLYECRATSLRIFSQFFFIDFCFFPNMVELFIIIFPKSKICIQFDK